jgi:hypothetical protein
MKIPNIAWKEPWQTIQSPAEIAAVQKQLEREITARHPLYGKGATAIGRRIDNDDVLVYLEDEILAHVHLIWGSGPDACPDQYPTWFLYGSFEAFVQAMNEDAVAYGDEI